MNDRLINIFAGLVKRDMSNYTVDQKKKNEILKRLLFIDNISAIEQETKIRRLGEI